MKKCFALSKTFGLTAFAPFGDAPQGREPRPAAPFGRAREGDTCPEPQVRGTAPFPREAPRLLQDLTPPPA
jgi:hypothetical protein